MKRFSGYAAILAAVMVVAPVVTANQAFANHTFPYLTVNANPSQVDTGADVTISGTVAAGENATRALSVVLTGPGSTTTSKSMTVAANTANYSVPFSAAELGGLSDGAVQVLVRATNSYYETAQATSCFVKGAPIPPTVTGQPVAPDGVIAGRSFSLTATASACPAPAVQWQVRPAGDDTDFIDIAGATSTTLNVVSRYSDDGSTYRAVFTGGGTSSMSAPVVVRVAARAPDITGSPTNASVQSGSSASFSSSAGGDPAPTVQWERAAPGSDEFVAVEGATASTYSIESTTYADNGSRFRAAYSNIAGTVRTSPGLLTVELLPPTVVQQPSDASVASGDEVSFVADASSEVAATVQWQQAAPGGEFTDIDGATSATLTLTAAFAQDQYRYQTVFTNPAGTVTTRSALLTVQALAPQVTANPEDVTVLEGDSASFSAAAAGDPVAAVQWQVSTDDGASYTDVPGATLATFTVAAADRGQHLNLYRAVFDNGQGGATSDPARLRVEFAPEVTLEPQDVVTASGGDAAFTAEAVGNPVPAVQWQASTDGGGTFTDIDGAVSRTFETSGLTTVDDGTLVRAVFTSTVGEVTTRAALLTVDAVAPTLTTDVTDQQVLDGTEVTFTAAAAGDPDPTVQWFVARAGDDTFTPIDGATGAWYTFTASAADTGNRYYAEFSNAAGITATRTATLTVTEIPPGEVPSAPETMVATQTGPRQVTVTWTPPATEGDSPVTSYLVGYSQGNMGNGQEVGPEVRSFVFDDLEPGEYVFIVRAVNADGFGEGATQPVEIVVPADAPVVTPPTSATVPPKAGLLAVTGSQAALLAAAAMALIVAGGVAMAASRRRRHAA